MKIGQKRGHVIDFLFPVAVLFVFAVSAVTVLLLATNIYSSITDDSSRSYTAGTSLAYITEKLRQNDIAGAVQISQLDGNDALVMTSSYNGVNYYTYIYEYDDELRELYVREGAEVSAAAGKAILPIEEFSMEEISEGVFSFTCVDDEGNSANSIVTMRSKYSAADS